MCKTCQNCGLKNRSKLFWGISDLGNKIVRDSPMANFVSQTMNKHIKMRLWSLAAKSILPGNVKCSMTSLTDTKHIFRERFIFRSWLRPRAVSRLRLRFARDKIIKSLRLELHLIKKTNSQSYWGNGLNGWFTKYNPFKNRSIVPAYINRIKMWLW